jgi:protein-export membrane protein SecD
MHHITLRVLAIAFASVLLSAYIFPWIHYGIEVPYVSDHPYKLGLDLQGGVELDYRVDFAELDRAGATYSANDVVEGLKSIVEKRVNSLGTAEPTIQSASYAGEQHIIVQIPTESVAVADGADAEADRQAYIERAKETIGRVVQLEFREKKTEITDADKAEREQLMERAYADLQRAGTGGFVATAKKYRDQNENLEFLTGTGTAEEIPKEVAFTGIEAVSAPYISKILPTKRGMVMERDSSGNWVQGGGDDGWIVVSISDIKNQEMQVPNATQSGATASGAATASGTHTETKRVYAFDALFVSAKPSDWQPAKTKDGKVLNDRYLANVATSTNQVLQPMVDLYFNEEGTKIFAELSTRLVGKQMAIFVGGEMLTAPVIQEPITTGTAQISGNFTVQSAKQLANDIKTGIVPAPIYLTSERTIDAKIGADALRVVLVAGLIGLAIIVIFLLLVYRLSGLLAGLALVFYAILLMAIVKMFGVVLTLASIAGVILSIGLAIDANILIFERVKEELRAGNSRSKAVSVGFDRSWATIWDSHLTSLSSAVILFIFGISLIKGFGLMLGIGIVVSLFTAMYVSRIFLNAVQGSKISDSVFVGVSDKK